jgi:hypothetical protein
MRPPVAAALTSSAACAPCAAARALLRRAPGPVARLPARAAPPVAPTGARARCAAGCCAAARRARGVRARCAAGGNGADTAAVAAARTSEEAAAPAPSAPPGAAAAPASEPAPAGPEALTVVEAAAQEALAAACSLAGGPEARAACVAEGLADLRTRLAGWGPPVAAPGQAASAAAPQQLPALADVALDGTSVAARWELPCGGALLVRARAVAADETGAAALLVDAVTNLAAPGRVLMHWGVCDDDAQAGGTWELQQGEQPSTRAALAPDDGAVAAAQQAQAPRRMALARLRPPPGAAALCFLLQTSAGVVDAGGREFSLPLPSGLLAQVAADAAAAGGCVARITLALGRSAQAAGALLAVVRDAPDGSGGVVVELFSDAPHALVLQWGLLAPASASGAQEPAGVSRWRAPPPELEQAGAARAVGGALLTPFRFFRAHVAPPQPQPPRPGAQPQQPVPQAGAATLQRACLAFSAAAVSRYDGLAFVLRSADGAFAWRNNWGHYEVPWAAEACAAAWE